MISHKYRFNWNSPIAVSPQNPKVVYFGGNVLFKSTDFGMSWQPISPDLTTNDPTKQQSLRRADRRRQHGGGVPLHDPDDRAVAARLERDLGRHGRRQRAGHARRWEDVDERVQERAGPQA